ncbi:hypothetical protein DPX16_7435 [Anabarilius grahami]|uniref:Uncharacterized protein n=1 Tax=Anabarilius grahami TaxID=495550 RepID=A0A3N0Z2E9_ANAGA|nr:hypothetical protein DPX16_7435 [Anabarilius grahami]
MLHSWQKCRIPPRSRSLGENHGDEALLTTNTAENTSKPPDTCVTDGPFLPVRDEKGKSSGKISHILKNTLPEHPARSRSLCCQVYGYGWLVVE